MTKRLDDLCADIEQTNPAADCLGGWKTFFEADIDPEEPIPHLLHALDKAFGYRTYEDNEMKQAEVDDLATRKIAWERAGALCEHETEIRAAHRYSKLQPSGQSVLADLHDKLKSLRKRLGKLEDLLESTAKLQSQVLDPLDDIRDTYKTRFLQAFDQVTGKCEAVRAAVEQLPSGADFGALVLLEKIDALSGIDTRALRGQLEHAADGLFATELDRNRVERALRDRPIPEGCSLQVDEAEQHIEQAETAERQAIATRSWCAGGRCQAASAAGAAKPVGAGKGGGVHRRGSGGSRSRDPGNRPGQPAVGQPGLCQAAGEIPQEDSGEARSTERLPPVPIDD